MLILLFVLALLGLDVIPKGTSEVFEPKKLRVDQLMTMTKCRLGVHVFSYNNYGCYCGRGGSGDPVDEIDECCQIHDRCYEKARPVCTFPSAPYLKKYDWKCNNGSISCELDQDECNEYCCACDKALTDCWAQYPTLSARAGAPKKSCPTDSFGRKIEKMVVEGMTDVIQEGTEFAKDKYEKVKKWFGFG